MALAAGFEVGHVSRGDFDHGGTRRRGVEVLDDCDIVVCMTQDAVFCDEFSLEMLIRAFDNELVALAWGRQLPAIDATPAAALARQHNYPAHSRVVSLMDRQYLGLKTAFASNSFSAWRREALCEIGNFPQRSLFGEDMLCSARLLLNGKYVAYVAEASVRHSHNYTFTQEFRRYVDIGVFHARETWLLREFGTAESQGIQQLKMELRALRGAGIFATLSCFPRAAGKWLGYRIGRMSPWLPVSVMRRLSMYPGWWR
jgi:rhamnosyltransferase